MFPTTPPTSGSSVSSAAAFPASGAAGSVGQVVKPKLSLEMFAKPRFGGSLSSAVKPNLSVAQKPTQLLSSTVTASSDSVNMATPTIPASTSRVIRTVSPLSLPPSSLTPVTITKRPSTEISPIPPVSDEIASPVPTVPLPPFSNPPTTSQYWLPEKLKKTLPVQDQQWIAAALWRNQRLHDDLKLWYEPPNPSLIYHQVPTPERFFCHLLLLWMPYHLWRVRVFCPRCSGHLTGGSVHKRARQVLDIDRNYIMITETLRCSNAGCKASYLSSTSAVLDQLDLPRRSEFRIIMTRKYACDIRVIRLMRERTLGNSSTRLAKQLKENHSEEWLQRLARYFGECADFMDRPSLIPVTCQEPPEPVAVPTNRWLMTVYAKDIISRMDHIKATITSVFGSILKMDSTKKITKKLAGAAKGTALWLTSVSNELGQILISVLTTQEGPGLDVMVADLFRRHWLLYRGSWSDQTAAKIWWMAKPNYPSGYISLYAATGSWLHN
ncbi:uncharacterized protein LOC110962328 isoform X2 [Acanthochromis polyacanthus]|uniref:uncharacterized protein LOC110962328 isoform X2 n=1 Tax=Acanthochromis polyacanthus TaxID=80966 RepID=UPI0022345DB5|nr:uncharacterized protein LOC110962328 isoform X2 [Acanthochromis polyacanthus]